MFHVTKPIKKSTPEVTELPLYMFLQHTNLQMEVLSKPSGSTGFQVQQDITQLTDKKGNKVKDAPTRTSILNFKPPCRAL